MAGNIHFRFIPTKRGGETLVIDGYMLRVSKHIATKKHWKCEVGDCKVGYASFRRIPVLPNPVSPNPILLKMVGFWSNLE